MSNQIYGRPSATSVTVMVLICAAAIGGVSADGADVGTAAQLDPALKNIKYIENKVIPDVKSLANERPRAEGVDAEKWQQVQRFMEDGMPVLELYGYKPKRDTQFTMIIPKIDVRTIEKPRLKEFMLEHLVPGKVYDNFADEDVYGNGNGHKIHLYKVEKSQNSLWLLNGYLVLYKIRLNDNLMAIAIDGYLGDRKSPYSKRNIQESNSRYNEPQRLEMRNTTTTHAKIEPILKESKSSPLMSFLNSMKSGTKVFQHFLSKSNLTQIMDDGSYTILIPSDNAFQRWHPIDWGFYPFSVHEFTESVLRNHFLPTQHPLRMAEVKNADQMVVRTMGGENVVFRGHPSPTVNNVSIMSDYALVNGNQVFLISEVLFVSEAVVSKLHQMHKDKETPPLLAFPWFGAQFLSHSFLALERDPRFTQITRYLNNAEIAPHVSGANYTFFVPEDKAFERLGFDRLSDDVMASPRGIKMLLNHFVRGRLYDRDLRDNEVFETIGGGHIKITRNPGSNATSVNNAKITESEVFVYNLGTMFYIDDILYAHLLREYVSKPTKTRSDPNGSGGGGGRKSTVFRAKCFYEIIFLLIFFSRQNEMATTLLVIRMMSSMTRL
ncbi:uncharacterized protein LOC105222049 isoform X1 [Bactrocera dorsalis]|uniref:Uncharacterized protein LOC105222049 isoform X1 n=1 Tax=Bactrocera dorsalis TaxID=27457 RepID=A0ABM3J278_BACDO|nr:uncharacterized protein LOC105222049 isoform X1 [Bactrocera dorsalis]XP_049303334.1 uncharacterized protein LOC105222049 isoform X1 [Bactrocera dorsalis]XP_049303336.1 uncharacterized protein LOC105222049 isoform X1 [Bactrocera dorsalis]XP_049303337.1 uncharacterized protein LOC105222049 isoform X1 [Bactrocera dorsalis]XP_049303338.1 uncharacterized protein LOC105222049 isoform X1 [Bactrocera dorsalis]